MESKLKSKLEPIEVTLARRWADFRLRRGAWLARLALRAKGKRGPAAHPLLFLLCIGVVLNLGMIAMPGYFGKDDIAHHLTNVANRSLSEVLSAVNWFDFSDIHYRPLTLSIWHTLSFFLYEAQVLYHLSAALLSVLNGVLIYHLVLRFSGQPRAALWGFLAFNIFPSSAFVVGWGLATVGDNLYLTFALAALHILLLDRNAALQRLGAPWSLTSLRSLENWKLSRAEILRQTGIALCIVLGLMSKEAMLPFPAVIAGLFLLVRPWRGWFWSLIVSSAVVGIYLALRLQVMIVDNPYVSSPALSNVLRHMPDYWVWPGLWNNVELLDAIAYSTPLQLALAAFLASLPVLFLLRRRKWRFALAYPCYYYVFVSPGLLHCCTYGNLLYGAALSVAVMFAYAFRREEHSARVRAVACILFAVLAAHSVYIQADFYKRGVMQQRAVASLGAIVRGHDLRAGNEEAKFAIVGQAGETWRVLFHRFWPSDYNNLGDVAGLNLTDRLTVHHSWEGHFHEIPAGSVLLRITPEGYVVEE